MTTDKTICKLQPVITKSTKCLTWVEWRPMLFWQRRGGRVAAEGAIGKDDEKEEKVVLNCATNIQKFLMSCFAYFSGINSVTKKDNKIIP